MDCWACRADVSLDDNYCRECGASIRAQTLPALLPERRVTRRPGPAVPAVLVSGMTALALGKVGQWVLRKATSRLASALLTSGTRWLQHREERQSAPLPTQEAAPPGTYRIATFVQQWVQIFEIKPEKSGSEPNRKRGLFRRG